MTEPQTGVESSNVPVEPWTESITIGWRPELRFYEERYSLLRAFDDSGDLRAFRVGNERIDARLFEPIQELSVQQDGLALHTFAPSADTTKGWDALRRVVGRLGITRFTEAQLDYQHVLELPEIAFEDAVAASWERLFTALGTSDVVFNDWAFTADIVVTGPPESKGVAEFGIIRPHEAPPRLARRIGRHVQHARPGLVPSWSPDDFKDVSLFADTHLALDSVEPAQGETALDRLHAFWGSSREQVGALAVDLVRRLVSNKVDNQGGMTG
jgi:hypothetical protein